MNSYVWRAQAMANRRRRNNAGADEITQAIHRMVDAMQPIAAQPRAVVTPTRPVSMEDFMRHKPSKFVGKSIGLSIAQTPRSSHSSLSC